MSASFIVTDVDSSLTLVRDVSDLDSSQTPLQDMSDALMSNAKYHTSDGGIAWHGGANPFFSFLGDGYRIHGWLDALIADVDLIGHAFLAIEESNVPPPPKPRFLQGFQALRQALARMSAVYAGVKNLQWDVKLCESAWESQNSLEGLFYLLPNNQRLNISAHLRGNMGMQAVKKWALADSQISHLQAELANHAQVIMARLCEIGLCACRSGHISTAANETCRRGVQESTGSVSAGLSFTRQSAVVGDPRANGVVDNGSLSIYTAPSLTTETTAESLRLSHTNDAKERPTHDLDSQYSEYENDRDTDCPKSEIIHAPLRDSRSGASHELDFCDSDLRHLGPELQVSESTASTRLEVETANVWSLDEFPQLASLINPAGGSCSWRLCAGCNRDTHTTAHTLESQTVGLSYATDRWFKSHEEPWGCLRMPARSFLRDALHGTSSSGKVEPRLGNVRLHSRAITVSHNEPGRDPRSPTPSKDCSLAHLFANLNLRGDGNREHLAIGIMGLANGSEETSTLPVGSHESSKKSEDLLGKRKSKGPGRNGANSGSSSCGEDDPSEPPRKQRNRRSHPPYFEGYMECLYQDMPTHDTCSKAFRNMTLLKWHLEKHHGILKAEMRIGKKGTPGEKWKRLYEKLRDRPAPSPYRMRFQSPETPPQQPQSSHDASYGQHEQLDYPEQNGILHLNSEIHHHVGTDWGTWLKGPPGNFDLPHLSVDGGAPLVAGYVAEHSSAFDRPVRDTFLSEPQIGDVREYLGDIREPNDHLYEFINFDADVFTAETSSNSGIDSQRMAFSNSDASQITEATSSPGKWTVNKDIYGQGDSYSVEGIIEEGWLW